MTEEIPWLQESIAEVLLGTPIAKSESAAEHAERQAKAIVDLLINMDALSA